MMAPTQLLMEQIPLITESILQCIFWQRLLDGSLAQMVISHLDLLQRPLYDCMEVLTTSNSHKRNTPHHAEDEIKLLSRNLLNISFSSSDPRPSNWDPRDPLLISGFIFNMKIHRIYIGNGSCSDILYEHCFRQLPNAWKEGLRPPTGGPLVGFSRRSLWPLGIILLPLTLVSHDERDRITRTIRFSVIRYPTEHNIMLGRSTISLLHLVPSTIHGIIKFSTCQGSVTVLATNTRAYHCHQIIAAPYLVREPKKSKDGCSTEQHQINMEYPEQLVRIGSHLTDKTRARLVALLKQYSTKPIGLTGVDRQVIERNIAINAEVADLVNTDILREVMFRKWIANPIMVKKANGSWRICIDYSDLNNACPKDCYPLSEIDQKVQSLEGFQLKCFLDAYKSCHQKMSFGLKNAGATYQRLMDKVFTDQIGRNIEVYVDYMVVKCRNEESLLHDVEETFQMVAKAKMKLNPTKCTFGVEEGQFLGYQISKEGILPNPTKIQEFLESKTPHNLNGVQEINGRLTTLGRFITKSTEKAFPLYQTLKGCLDKKQFKWTKKEDVELQQLKDALHQLPPLACPVPGETLQLYLAASKEAISSVLAMERERKQVPVYFVSRALQGLEVNYPSLEKPVLALVYAVRHLRSYPIKQVLLRLEKSWRQAKWAIELGEHDIRYHPELASRPKPSHTSYTIKGVLTAISVDPLEPEADKELWKLYTDVAASKGGSCASLILQIPKGEEIIYALIKKRGRLRSTPSKSRVVKEVGAKQLAALSDSLFIINQINRTYEAKDSRMHKYLDPVRNLTNTFKCFSIKQIPRGKNARGDALNNLASNTYDHLTKKVLVEVLPERSIDNQWVNTVSITPEWNKPYVNYLRHGVFLDDSEEARNVKISVLHFAIRDNQLYRRGGQTFLKEIHSGDVIVHEGA
uniref:Reverse transcriptase domain-containing protein n=1 Tax=Lactuca sativa TaxID=4236 RepID=A0A9R1WSS0_LACSA|nr:hypothetical protein LSAT_V11C100030700 [Lactuca sativa]